MVDVSGIRRTLNRSLNRRRWGYLFLIVMPLMTFGCATAVKPKLDPPVSSLGGETAEQMLRAEILSWLGTPHRMGGMSRRGIDCSGLVVILYDDLFNLRLPRTTRALMRAGWRVDRENLVAGDLVFFTPKSRTHHVGIYLGMVNLSTPLPVPA
jgi:cell wall-associated NlpC family hydrolase